MPDFGWALSFWGGAPSAGLVPRWLQRLCHIPTSLRGSLQPPQSHPSPPPGPTVAFCLGGRGPVPAPGTRWHRHPRHRAGSGPAAGPWPGQAPPRCPPGSGGFPFFLSLFLGFLFSFPFPPPSLLLLPPGAPRVIQGSPSPFCSPGSCGAGTAPRWHRPRGCQHGEGGGTGLQQRPPQQVWGHLHPPLLRIWGNTAPKGMGLGSSASPVVLVVVPTGLTITL